MENPIRQNLYKIGEILRTLGDNMCQETHSKEDLNFQKIFNPHLLDLFKTVLKIPSDLDEWRKQIEKEEKRGKNQNVTLKAMSKHTKIYVPFGIKKMHIMSDTEETSRKSILRIA